MVSPEIRSKLDYLTLLMAQEGAKWGDDIPEAAVPFKNLTDKQALILLDTGYAALKQRIDEETERLSKVVRVARPVEEERERIVALIRAHAHNLFWISSSHTAERIADAIENDRWPTVHIDFDKDVEYDSR